jgi:hypothetical protein
MQADVAKLRQLVAELQVLSKKALGEDVQSSGGLFGLGAQKEVVPTGTAMAQLLTNVGAAAVTAYNVSLRALIPLVFHGILIRALVRRSTVSSTTKGTLLRWTNL